MKSRCGFKCFAGEVLLCFDGPGRGEDRESLCSKLKGEICWDVLFRVFCIRNTCVARFAKMSLRPRTQTYIHVNKSFR